LSGEEPKCRLTLPTDSTENEVKAEFDELETDILFEDGDIEEILHPTQGEETEEILQPVAAGSRPRDGGQTEGGQPQAASWDHWRQVVAQTQPAPFGYWPPPPPGRWPHLGN
jgi:hypothetical protein